jgi:hypothetical protein
MSVDKPASPGMKGTATAAAKQNLITAIDILLEPDATMIRHAQAANAGLLKNYPKGYTLDNEHQPHISVMGGYMYTANLDKLYAAVGKVLANQKVMSWKLKAFKYYYMPLKEIGLGGIVVEPTADLVRLQKELIDTIEPFRAPSSAGSAAAYVTTPQDPDINQATLDAVATYFPGNTGEHYSPHVTIGGRHGRLPGRPARCTVPHVQVFACGSVRLPVRQLRNCSETTPLVQADTVRKTTGFFSPL